jgi:hypothetical protein
VENDELKEPQETGTEERIGRITLAMDALRNIAPEQAISAMPVIVPYFALVAEVEHVKRGEEHFFTITTDILRVGPNGERSHRELISQAVRDEFLRVGDSWSEAYDFLCATGNFSPLGDTVTWTEFKRWQQFARLVQEHKQLASVMESNKWGGEFGEALKALHGGYPSSYFAFHGVPTTDEQRACTERQLQQHPELRQTYANGRMTLNGRARDLYGWFREPPPSAYSVEWFPKNKEDEYAVLPKLQIGGAMAKYLLPREALRPALVIRPRYTLEAIAAAIYADYANGVEYRTCEFCNRLFPVGRQKTKKYCNQARCKNAAHSRTVRENERKRRAESKIAAKNGNTRTKSKSKQTRQSRREKQNGSV